DCIAAIAPFLSPEGRFHAHASFYGYDKRGHWRFRALCQKGRSLTPVGAGLTTALPLGLCGLRFNASLSWYVLNFLYSFQRGFRQVYRFMFEVFTVEPYSIYWGYRDYADALAQSGLEIEQLFPHSISFVATRCTDCQVALRPPTGSIAI